MEENNGINNEVYEEGFLSKEDLEALKLIRKKERFNSLRKTTELIKEQQRSILKDEDLDEVLTERIKDLSSEQIKALTNEEIDAIYTLENGESIKLETRSHDRDMEFKKDFLIFKKDSDETFETIDKELAALDASLVECKDEFDAISAKYANVSDLIYEKLESKVETATTEEEKEKYVRILKAYRDGLSLDPIKDFYSNSYKRSNVLPTYFNDKSSFYLKRRYERVLKSLELTSVNLLEHGYIEKRFIKDEKYLRHDNIFLFAVMYYLSTWLNSDGTVDKVHGIFLTQFNLNVKKLMRNEMDEQTQETFINRIKEIIDLVDPS